MSNPSNRNNNPVIFGGNARNNNLSNPREESFGRFTKDFCCPSFSFFSFTFFISLIDLLMYLLTISKGLNMNPMSLLAPTDETLDKFGMKFPLKQHQGQIWRFVTYSLLHANFVHLVTNLFSQLIIGSMMEGILGWWRMLILYVLISYLSLILFLFIYF